MSEKHLILEVIWKDKHMLEYKISAQNGRYSGTTEVYVTNDQIETLILNLSGFPNGKDNFKFSAGESDDYSFIEFNFSQFDSSGKVEVSIRFEENLNHSTQKNKRDILEMSLLVEPAAIDNFCIELQALTRNNEGSAMLKGI